MSDLEELFAFQMKAAKLPEPTREFVFHPTRRWRFDFAWPDRTLACEVDGGEWVRGRHQRPGGFRKDAEKFSTAAAMGWLVLRVTGSMVEDGSALTLIELALTHPSRASVPE